MKQLMKKNILGKYIINGVFFNNEGPEVNLNKLENKLIYVSQYRTFKKRESRETKDTIRDEFHGLKFSWEQFRKADLDVAIALKDFCMENDIKFEIAGTSINDKIEEKKFFSEKLGEDGWTYLESSIERRGIYLTSNAKYIVTIDSTLGYECLARGQRVCFFSIRSKYLKSDYAKFGWPLHLSEEGKCWTTNNSKEDFKRLMNFLVFEDDIAWKKILDTELRDLVFYNRNNSLYKKFLKTNNLINDATN
jgi:surface carbohydrate biosynthesis protein